MDCLEFRRICGSEPTSRDKAFLEHRLACPSCAAQAAEARSFDDLLRQAMSVDLPEGLVQRIVADASMRQAHRARWVALAATTVLAVGAVIGVVRVDQGTALADDVVEHIHHEPDLLIPTTELVDEARLHAVAARSGSEIQGDLGGEVRYAGLCRLRGQLVAHLVVQGESGPVTVLLLPTEAMSSPVEIDERGLKGAILPLEGGSIAVVGTDDERELETVQERVRGAVRWSI